MLVVILMSVCPKKTKETNLREPSGAVCKSIYEHKVGGSIPNQG